MFRPSNRWWTVLAGALGCAAGCGMVASYVFGVYTKAIAEEFHWSRSEATMGVTAFYISVAIGHVVLGSALAKSDVRRTTILWVLVFAGSVAAVGLLPPSPVLFCLVFGLMGFFGAAATAMPYAYAVSYQFDRNRGLALALVNSGTGISGIFMASFAAWLLHRYGWRGGYAGVGLFVGVVAMVGLIVFFRMPPVKKHEDDDITLAAICRNTDFWLISAPIFLISIALLGIITNLAPMLTDRGMALGDAAKLLGLLGGASWVARIGTGFLVDRLHVRLVAAAIFLMVASGGLIVLLGGVSILPLAVVFIGLGVGAEADLLTYMTSRYFSAGALSRALGTAWVGWGWGASLGVYFGSLSFDLTGSYRAALVGYVALAVLSALIVSRLGPYRHGAHKREAETLPGIAPAVN